MQITLTEKQTKAFDYLEDKTTKEILFGGSAGSAKSFTGCLWQLLRRLAHPNTRGLIGRAKLTDLKNTTLMTFFEVANMLGVNHKFKYNAHNNRILFNNGSIIFLKDLFLYPSDPEFVSLGSMEITDCFIDEAGDVCEKAYTILRTRIRYNLINGVPKMALGANPAQNWLYREFYKPFKDGTLPNDRKFVPSTARENKYIPHEYLISLDKLKGIDRERLRNGNWDYEDDNTVMIPYDAILGMFGSNWTDISGYSPTWDFTTENSEELLQRAIESTSNKSDLIFDFFLGSGTTTAVAHKLGRRWIGVEMGEHFWTVTLPRMKKVLAYDKSGISKEVKEYQGGGFFKYYELEQYEEALAKCKYEDSDLFNSPSKTPYQEYVFMKDEKMLDALEIDYEKEKVKVDLAKLYPNIDIAETLSNLTGKWIKKISDDEVEFEDGTKINTKDLDYKLIKPLIWWEAS